MALAALDELEDVPLEDGLELLRGESLLVYPERVLVEDGLQAELGRNEGLEVLRLPPKIACKLLEIGPPELRLGQSDQLDWLQVDLLALRLLLVLLVQYAADGAQHTLIGVLLLNHLWGPFLRSGPSLLFGLFLLYL